MGFELTIFQECVWEQEIKCHILLLRNAKCPQTNNNF